jgi:acyl-CoA synthetase (AMP-forming)/AMP-acid ligase II
VTAAPPPVGPYLHGVQVRLIDDGGRTLDTTDGQTMGEHPAVEDAAVTGEPDDDLGERIVAWVVRRPGKQVSGDELVSYVARMLDPHKRPRVVRFVDELPHDALGKVQKNRLPR